MLVVFWQFLSLSVAHSASIIPSTYDKEFKEYALLLPFGTDWRYLKAQAWQESRFDPFAVSPVGARGVMQFMPATAKDMQSKYDHLDDFWLPAVSINAGALYMRQLNNYWLSERPQEDRYKLALASYNAGAGNITKAQKKCGMAVLYDEIIKCLPDVTGRHSKETIDYVEKITVRWYNALLFE
ncbi:MAG: transglycosylase SLT domain-containing protein [Aestuariibacter sp.]|nr:transglycosylase SLT domain-containing protein [Aestuariibacter sp.]